MAGVATPIRRGKEQGEVGAMPAAAELRTGPFESGRGLGQGSRSLHTPVTG